jgi:hypothetical protein
VAVRVQSSDKRLSVSPAVFRVTPDVTLKRKTIVRDVPIRLEDAPSLGDLARSVTLRTSEVSVTLSWPLNLPEPAADSDGGVMATVVVDPATLERRRSMRLDVEAVGPNLVDILRIEPAQVVAVWSPPKPEDPPPAPPPAPPAPEAPEAPPAPEAPEAAPDGETEAGS